MRSRPWSNPMSRTRSLVLSEHGLGGPAAGSVIFTFRETGATRVSTISGSASTMEAAMSNRSDRGRTPARSSSAGEKHAEGDCWERATVFAAACALRAYLPLLPDLGIAQGQLSAVLPFSRFEQLVHRFHDW